MPHVVIQGVTLNVEEAGAGEPLLLLHGGLGTALLHWRRELPVFAERYRVLAPDLRGYGRSSPPREFEPGFYERDAADMAALLLARDAAPAHVIGWSDGAIVALVLAATRPALVRTLITIGGEARLLPEERAAWPALADAASWTETARQRFIEAQGPLNWPGILTKMIEGYNRVLDRDGGEIISRRLGEISCPTLIIHGDRDPVVPVVHAHELHARIRGSELHIYPEAGHLPHRDQPDDFRARALAFLRRHGAPRDDPT